MGCEIRSSETGAVPGDLRIGIEGARNAWNLLSTPASLPLARSDVEMSKPALDLRNRHLQHACMRKWEKQFSFACTHVKRIFPSIQGRSGPFVLLFLLAVCSGTEARDYDPDSWRRALEADWVLRETLLAATNRPARISPESDAAGGCDGIKNGRWGFHTASAVRPWWQVDLGSTQAIARVVIWNRCDAESAAARTTNLNLLFSLDAKNWITVYEHPGTAFYGFKDKKPLEVNSNGQRARFVRIELPGQSHLHLDEVEVFSSSSATNNLARHRPANQSGVSEWSVDHSPPPLPDWKQCLQKVLAHSLELGREWLQAGLDVEPLMAEARQLSDRIIHAPADSDWKSLYLAGRCLHRKLVLANPLLDFDTILFTKRVPSSFNHMSDQYYGWWSEPGGGLYLLRNFRGDHPTTECISGAFKEAGSFLRPTLSYDGEKVLFAWSRFYPGLAALTNKLDKSNVPENAFYHVFEMNLDGSGVRQLTHGKYDDFDARYLPDGRIVFLSTRRGQFVQVGRESASRTMVQSDLPDIYVRCGGGPERPVAVYTLHTMNADGSDLNAISPFEMFEWTPEVAQDGSILYSRWDYVDRDNMPYMGLWAINPDGTNARLIYKNYTRRPHCTFEPRSVPNSRKIVFTGSAHHAHTMGSLALLDPAVSNEGDQPLTRLTPEVPFPEIEGWPTSYYTSPYPLSERFYLVAWSNEGAEVPGPEGWDRWHAVRRLPNGMGLYFFDATFGPEMIYRDPEISSQELQPVRPRVRPPVRATNVASDSAEGSFILLDVYDGLAGVNRGTIKALRLVAIPPKTHPTMNFPNMGLTADDPGKCVLGTVPVENDGSAYFRAPAGVILFFQALDDQGMAVQTMRSATHVQSGQTLSCIGCHEPRQKAPPTQAVMAVRRAPSQIRVGPPGSWPLRFDQLVQPVLDRHCAECHRPGAANPMAAKINLAPMAAYETLVGFGKPSLRESVKRAYTEGRSRPGVASARDSALLACLRQHPDHRNLKLDSESIERLVTWMDTYAQQFGAFDATQEQQLVELRRRVTSLLSER